MIIRADARSLPLVDGCVDCVITSPPYWGLRDYGHGDQIGLEASPDAYVRSLVAVFAEVRRVLKDRGTLWLNLGDCYATGGGMVGEYPGGGAQGARWAGRGMNTKQQKWAQALGPICQPNLMPLAGLKAKDLVGLPWRVAFALQADGWYLRSDIIWSKPNPMPESVTDRPTKAHEYLFLLAKSERYLYDASAIAENRAPLQGSTYSQPDKAARQGQTRNGTGLTTLRHRDEDTRNKRTVWTVVGLFGFMPCAALSGRERDPFCQFALASGRLANVASFNRALFWHGDKPIGERLALWTLLQELVLSLRCWHWLLR